MPESTPAAASVYRGWTYIVHQASRFGWDVEIGSRPGDLLLSEFRGSPFRAMTEKRAEAKFRRWLDDDISERVVRAVRARRFAQAFGREYRPLPGDLPEPEEIA